MRDIAEMPIGDLDQLDRDLWKSSSGHTADEIDQHLRTLLLKASATIVRSPTA